MSFKNNIRNLNRYHLVIITSSAFEAQRLLDEMPYFAPAFKRVICCQIGRLYLTMCSRRILI